MSSAVQRCILHLDLDAFFAAVEQRDKPSLRGRPVVVGGLGPRGVVSTASYEARVYGARSAMPMAEARRRCPAGTAFLSGRHDAYRASSQVVMGLLRERSPLVEQVSVDEAYVDLLAGEGVPSWEPGRLEEWSTGLLERIAEETGGLTASVGIAPSKLMAKLGSEMNKPAGVTVIRPGEELGVLHPLPVRKVVGVGPATAARLHAFGVDTVADLARVTQEDLVSIFGKAHGLGLARLARAEDERDVMVEREAKSVSVEETFDTDITDRLALEGELGRMAARLAVRLERSETFARTITVKVRHHDFTAQTRSGTLPFATGDEAVLLREGRRLLGAVDVSAGLRLLGLGVSGLTRHAQDELELEGGGAAYPEIGVEVPDAVGAVPGAVGSSDGALTQEEVQPSSIGRFDRTPGWSTGQDVEHEEHGTGWVWGAGLGRVTVRFEGPLTGPGPVRTFASDDPALSPAGPPDWRGGPS